MNLKERGFTVGDLLIVLIVLLISFFAFNRSGEEMNKDPSLSNGTSIKNVIKLNLLDSHFS